MEIRRSFTNGNSAYNKDRIRYDTDNVQSMINISYKSSVDYKPA